MIVKPAVRTADINEYYFSAKLKEIDAINRECELSGLPKVINLGIGAPDGLPPTGALQKISAESLLPGNHAYQSYVGLPALREAFAGWYERFYHVRLNPTNEIQPLTGSKEGILLTSLAFVDKGDKVLVPDPGYPTYTSASKMVEAEIVRYNLAEENGWQPDFEALEAMDLSGVKLMWTNYPHMPTGAPASMDLYERLVEFGLKHKILIVNDNPYSFILNDNPLSILSVPGAKECCLELNSLSKAHNMSGWRIGMVAGASDAISEILKVKSQMDSGMFKPLQLAAIEALASDKTWFEELNAEYLRRRTAARRIFDLLGVSYNRNSNGLFLWGKTATAHTGAVSGTTAGETLSDMILEKARVFITPGFIFGHNGEDYVRISLCAPVEVLEEAYERISKSL